MVGGRSEARLSHVADVDTSPLTDRAAHAKGVPSNKIRPLLDHGEHRLLQTRQCGPVSAGGCRRPAARGKRSASGQSCKDRCAKFREPRSRRRAVAPDVATCRSTERMRTPPARLRLREQVTCPGHTSRLPPYRRALRRLIARTPQLSPMPSSCVGPAMPATGAAVGARVVSKPGLQSLSRRVRAARQSC